MPRARRQDCVPLEYTLIGRIKWCHFRPIRLHESFIGHYTFVGQSNRTKGTNLGEFIGYGRVSSNSQSLDVQIAALIEAGVREEHLYLEKASGRRRHGRYALDEMLSRGIRKGDVVVCTRLDRLARSTRDLLKIADTLEDKGVDLRVLEQPIDTSSAAGRLFFTMLGAFAEFEASIRADRQREGIDAALAVEPQ